jgi:hypothetical protein
LVVDDDDKDVSDEVSDVSTSKSEVDPEEEEDDEEDEEDISPNNSLRRLTPGATVSLGNRGALDDELFQSEAAGFSGVTLSTGPRYTVFTRFFSHLASFPAP